MMFYFSSSTSALDTSGYSSPAESSDDLDKAYWIRRAGEVLLNVSFTFLIFICFFCSYLYNFRKVVSTGLLKFESNLSSWKSLKINDVKLYFYRILLLQQQEQLHYS